MFLSLALVDRQPQTVPLSPRTPSSPRFAFPLSPRTLSQTHLRFTKKTKNDLPDAPFFARQIQLGQHPLGAARHHISARSAHHGPAVGHHARDLECSRQDHVPGGHQLVRLQGHSSHRRREDARAGAREPGGVGLEPVARGGGRVGCCRCTNKETVRAEYLPVDMIKGQKEEGGSWFRWSVRTGRSVRGWTELRTFIFR